MDSNTSMNPSASASATNAVSLNVNTAMVEQLGQLSGIGPKRAARIIELRESSSWQADYEDLYSLDIPLNVLQPLVDTGMLSCYPVGLRLFSPPSHTD